jgi:hypothetical protein
MILERNGIILERNGIKLERKGCKIIKDKIGHISSE